MDHEPTRQVLIEAAAELFAENGFDGVSTRMIAEKAGVNLGGIHYHFKTKENLYVEAFKFATEKNERPHLQDVVAEFPDRLKTPEGQAWLIMETIRHQFEHFALRKKLPWKNKMVMQTITRPSSALALLTNELFRPEAESTTKWLRHFKPELTEEEALALTDLMIAPVVFYMAAEAPLQLLRGEGFPLPGFCKVMARELSIAIIRALDLPLPKEMTEQKGETHA